MEISPVSHIAHAPAVANRLERALLEEMMKYAFPRAGAGAFSGGAGEDQFASFMAREQAALLSVTLDLGFDEKFKVPGGRS